MPIDLTVLPIIITSMESLGERSHSCHTCQMMACAIDDYYSFMDVNFNPTAPYPESSNDRTHCWRIESDRGLYKKINLGPIKDVENRNDCTSCRDIVGKSVKDSKRPSSQSILVFELHEQGLWIGPQDLEGFWLEDILLLLPLVTSRPSYEVGRPFDTQQIDIEMVRNWINCCQISHGDHCSSSELPLRLHQIYLIDVKESSLVLAPADSRYITLSYVWGDTAAVKTTKSNLIYLSTPGSISADVDNLAIPKTIRDAIRLVLLLGERYLWVDSFCII